MKQLFVIQPPLLNSANPWCSSLEQLVDLYSCLHTGAVTTRTSLINGFQHNESIHQFTFYNPVTFATAPKNLSTSGPDETGSLNTLGYSPIPLEEYLGFIQKISDSLPDATPNSQEPKPFIISVTGTPEDIVACYTLICQTQRKVRMRLAMEVNLSCPNILDKPPPAYDSATLLSYLFALKVVVAYQLSKEPEAGKEKSHVPIGVKTPPYTYHDQFKGMIKALLDSVHLDGTPDIGCPISFITATNTLGSSLLLTPSAEEGFQHALNSATGAGLGGLAGAPLHPLALGNVYTIRSLLDQHTDLERIQIIGVGGVEDVEGYKRMRSVGAVAVGVGTALGRKGVKVFDEIEQALKQGTQLSRDLQESSL
jgi:dihydroorotate dehydrogenase (fumarate)